MEGIRPPVEYNKNNFLATKRNYNTKRRNAEVGGRGRRGAALLSNHSLSKRSWSQRVYGRRGSCTHVKVWAERIKKIVREIKTEKEEAEKITAAIFFPCFSGFLAFFWTLSPSGYHTNFKETKWTKVNRGARRFHIISWGSDERLSLTLAAFKAPPKDPIASALLCRSSIANPARVSWRKKKKGK